MPLSKKRDKARKRIERALGAVQPDSNLNLVQPTTPKREKIAELQGLIGALQSKSSPLEEELRNNIPVYNPRVHKAGDEVRKFVNGRWKEVIVPQLDAENNTVPEYW